MRTAIKKRGAPRQELTFSFGPFRLVPGRQLLLLDERPVKLGGRAFELLRLLVQRRGELVSKNELTAAAWPGTFVHEDRKSTRLNSSHTVISYAVFCLKKKKKKHKNRTY